MQLISRFNKMWYTIEEQPFKYFWYWRQNTYGSIIIGIRFLTQFPQRSYGSNFKTGWENARVGRRIENAG